MSSSLGHIFLFIVRYTYPGWSHGKDEVFIIKSYHFGDVLHGGQRKMDRTNIVGSGEVRNVELREWGGEK